MRGKKKKTRPSDTVGFGLAVSTYSSAMMKSVEMLSQLLKSLS